MKNKLEFSYVDIYSCGVNTLNSHPLQVVLSEIESRSRSGMKQGLFLYESGNLLL